MINRKWKQSCLIAITMIGNLAIILLIFIATHQCRKDVIVKLSKVIENEILLILLSFGIAYIEISLLLTTTLIVTAALSTQYVVKSNQYTAETKQIIAEIFEEEKEPTTTEQQQSLSAIANLQKLKQELSVKPLEDHTLEISKTQGKRIRLINHKDPKTKNTID